MKWIAYKVFLLLLIGNVRNAETQQNIYNVWNDNGIHLMMSDNGTPNNFEDDFVVDWEDNRQVKVTILDN